MAIPKRVLALIASAVTGTMVFGAVAVGTQDRTSAESAAPINPPPTPAWVKADGTVDPSEIPRCVGVIGPDGRPVSKGDGEPVCVSRREIMRVPSGPPPKAPKEVNARNLALEKERRIVELPASSPANALE